MSKSDVIPSPPIPIILTPIQDHADIFCDVKLESLVLSSVSINLFTSQRVKIQDPAPLFLKENLFTI